MISVNGEFLTDLISRLIAHSDLETALINYMAKMKNIEPNMLAAALLTAKPDREEKLTSTIAKVWMKQGEAR